MNKKEMILSEAKRLSGHYGYLGFTLKQLAQACDMTAPALYYFYSSKADLFKDCLLSELELRHVSLSAYAREANSLAEFSQLLARDAFDKCGPTNFRTGQAMEEIIHLPDDIQTELRAAWDRLVIAPVEELLARVMPDELPQLPRYLVATFMINMATFAAANETRFGQDTLTHMLIAASTGLQDALLAQTRLLNS